MNSIVIVNWEDKDFAERVAYSLEKQGFKRTEIEALCGEPVSFAGTHFYRTFARFPRSAHFERFSALLEAMPPERLSQALRISGQPVLFPYCALAPDRHIRQPARAVS